MTTEPNQNHKIASGYIFAKKDGIEFFRSTFVGADHYGSYIKLTGFNDQQSHGFEIDIDLDTPMGDQPFMRGKYLRTVLHIDGAFTHIAHEGTYNAILNNDTKQTKLTFKLKFSNHSEIEGEVDITG